MKIQLPPFIIADLYKNMLIENDSIKLPYTNERNTKKSVQNKQETVQRKIYLGENKKNITILITDDLNIHIEDEKLQFLKGILAACQINLADVAIINCNHNEVSFESLKNVVQPKFIFLFGITTQTIHLPFFIPLYQIQHYDDCTILVVSALEELMGNSDEIKQEKRKLWNSMKAIFSIT